jgi:prepilin peptidase CpaA
MTSPHFVVLVVGLAACVLDVRSRRIPNEVTFGAALAGFAVHAWSGGAAGAAWSAAGWAAGVALLFPFFALRGMGAGDVKLLAAFGAWLGAAEIVHVAIAASIVGAVLALGVAATRGYLHSLLGNVQALVTTWVLVGVRPVPGVTLDDAQGPRLAYAISITVGAVVTLWL